MSDLPDRNRPRLLVLASTFPRWRGDSEPPFVLDLSAGLADDFDVTVLAPAAEGARRSERWRRLRVVRFPYFWPARLQKLAYGGILPNLKRNKLLWLQVPFLMGAELIATVRMTRRLRPDAIHAHWVLPQGLIAAITGRLTGTPVLVTAHGGCVHALRGNLPTRLKRWTLANAAGVSAVSADLAAAVSALQPPAAAEPATISMGVDCSRFGAQEFDVKLRQRLNPDGPVLLFVGRLAEKKGVEYLLQAMPAVIDTQPQVKLAVVGDGPMRKDLEEACVRLGIAAHVDFLGAMPPSVLPDYYASADICVAPSVIANDGDREGLPVVVMEAMASGCAVVATDAGGIGEAISDGETGLLVRQRDPVMLAAAINRLLADAGLRTRLGEKAALDARERFDQHRVSGRYADVLRGLIRAA